MNIQTFSPALVLVFCWILICILMGIDIKNLPPKKKTALAVSFIVLAVFNHMLRDILGSASYSDTILFTLHIPTFVFFIRLTGCSVIKMFFMIMTALVFTSPTVILWSVAKRFFLFDSAAALFITNFVSYVIIFALAFFALRKSFRYLLEYGDDQLFALLTLIPFIYYIYALSVLNLDLSSLSSAAGYIVRFTPMTEVFIFYLLLPLICNNIRRKNEFEIVRVSMSQKIASYEERIALLNDAQSKIAIYHHDMRHHLLAIEGFLSAGKTDQARDYIEMIRSDLDSFIAVRYCENGLVNLLCSSFADKAKNLKAKFDVSVSLPDSLPISDTEICSIISNGLENAFNAISSLEEERRTVSFYCGIRRNKLLIEIKNPYSGKVTMHDGLPVSDNIGHGYGCRSIRTIAERKKGLCSFETENDTFILRVVLPMQTA